MEFFNVLTTAADTVVTVFGQTYDVSLNWIGNLIRLLCGAIGVVGVGIILFSLILKLITLPFDIYQRISMRKQNIQMKANQEKMEKLQKQYANDKQMYNQKVMEMYKENGISVFSSCLPMILSLVIFIVAINAFNAYAQYSNVENYNIMVNAYNADLKAYCVELDENNYDSVVTENNPADSNTVTYTVKSSEADKILYYEAYLFKDKTSNYAEMTSTDKLSYILAYPNKVYKVDEARAMQNAEIARYVSEHTDVAQGVAIKNYLEGSAQDAVVEAYETQVKSNTDFLWIKNIWVTDASYKNPVLSATDFKAEAEREEFEVNGEDVSYNDVAAYTNAYGEVAYNQITGKLDQQKRAANGYFVLIALSIGTILLQQFVMMRSQKEQQKYSSVDGTAGSQQKMTMIIMTGMFAIFSFMYSSAFSIYLITSNLFSMLSTLIINKFVDRKMEKVEAAASVQRYKNYAAERIEKAKNAGKESAQESKKKK